MNKTKNFVISNKFVNQVPIIGGFSIVEPGGTFDGLDDLPAQLHIQFNDGFIKISIQNLFHPRGKIVKKLRRDFTLGNIVEIISNELGDDSVVTNGEDIYGFHVDWWSSKQANNWIDELLILARLFPDLTKTLINLPVVDVVNLYDHWDRTLTLEVGKIKAFADGLECVGDIYKYNFNLSQLAKLVGVPNPNNIEEIGNLLQDMDSNNLIIPADWERRQISVRRNRTRRKPTTLLEISACNTEDDLIALLSKPPPASLESFSLALTLWISFGLGKESSSNEIEKNVALISWLGKSKFIPALHDSEPEIWSAYRGILGKWAADNFIPNHPMAGMIATPKRLRRTLANEVLAAFYVDQDR